MEFEEFEHSVRVGNTAKLPKKPNAIIDYDIRNNMFLYTQDGSHWVTLDEEGLRELFNTEVKPYT